MPQAAVAAAGADQSVAVCMLDDVTEQGSQYRRGLKVEELGREQHLGHASSMADFG
jgi:hypothetical protein